jgi:uncharacterized secreted protein with C-terminal beta-propeller domain
MDILLTLLVITLGFVFIGSLFWKLMTQTWFQYKTLSTFLLLISAILLTGISVKTASPQTANPFIQNPTLKKIGNETTLVRLIEENAQYQSPTMWFDIGMGNPTAESDNGAQPTPRDVIGTNNQVEGIEEGDIVKTDSLGQRLFYSSYYSNHVNVLDVHPTTNLVTIAEKIDLGSTYTQALYVTETYLIVIGYRYDLTTFGDAYCAETEDQDIVSECIQAIGYQETGTLMFIDLDTLAIVYTLETDFSFMDYRLINDSLFLVGNRYLYQGMEDVQPTFTSTLGENTPIIETLSFDQMFYFENSPVYSMTILVGLKVNDDPTLMEWNSDAYLGSSLNFKSMYVSMNAMYLSQSFYHYEDNRSFTTMKISQFDLNIDEATLTYRASTEVRGQGLNQFSMDEYEGYLRLATTEVETSFVQTGINDMAWEWNQTITNFLYIMRVNEQETFDLVGVIDEGLGKPNESIRSVRFQNDQAFIVTFFNTDPLYIIDLSDPTTPTILDDIELPGFDTYQHVWGENQLIGLGFAATPEGQITGMKLTAYNTTVGAAEELQTFEFTSNITEERDDFTYYYAFSYGEALYNHKALMISPEHGLLGLGVTSWVYGWRQTDENESSESDEIVNEDYYYAYQSYYAIFKIDFNADQVIADPILIEHPESQDYYVTVDRGVYIDGVVHTLSNQRVISYDLNQDAIVQSLTLFEPDNRL